METKKNCIAEIIHHIATILGFFIAGYYFLQKRTKTFCKVLLSVHMVTQGYGILKNYWRYDRWKEAFHGFF